MPLAEADYGTTDMALGRNPRFAGDSKLWVEFHVRPREDQEESAKAGRPIFKDTEYVRIFSPGNKDNVIDRPVGVVDKKRFQRQYDAWKSGQEAPKEGTPLEEWPEITRSEVEEFKHFKIRTVEQLVEMPDTSAQNFMGIETYRRRARAFLDSAKKNAGTTKLMKELETRDNRIASLQKALESMQEQMKKVQDAQSKGA